MSATVFDHTPPHLSVVVPVYNEYESLRLLHERLAGALEPLGYDWEVVYVDDGSTDGSTDVLLDLYTTDERVSVCIQRRNFGKSSALRAGFAIARGRIIVTMDADLQDEPNEIPRLVAKLDEGHDIVSSWKKDRKDPLSKRLPSWIANTVTATVSGLKIHDMNSGMKAYRTTVVRRLTIYGDQYRYIPLIAHFAGYNVAELPVVHHPRRFGQSKYGIRRVFTGGLDLITVLFLNQYGSHPLHLFGLTGAALLFVGFLINLELTIEWFLEIGAPLHQRPLLILGVLLMVIGIQLITMGLIAELIVAFEKRNEDPLATAVAIYTVESKTNELQPEPVDE